MQIYRTHSKRIFLVIVLLVIVAYICFVQFGLDDGTGRQSNNTTDDELPMTISAYDTTSVLSLVNEYLTNLKEGNYDAALNMLHVLDQSELPANLNSEQRQRHRMSMMLYHVYDYKIEKLTFWRQTDSRLDYSIIITQPNDGSEPARIRCALRPVRYMDVWYLTIADDRQMKENSEI